MTASSISVNLNRYRKAFGYFRGAFKALVLLGMCGGLFYLSNFPPGESMPKERQLREGNFDLLVTTSSPQDESTSEVVCRTEENSHNLVTSSSPQGESKPELVQLTKKNFDIPLTFSSPLGESKPEIVQLTKKNFDILVTSSSPKSKSEAEIVQLTKKNFNIPVTSSSPQGESKPEIVQLTKKNFEILVTSSSPQGESKPEIVQLTKGNFELLVTSSSKPWLVEFYAPWCHHCKTFANDYIKIAERLRGVVNVGKVNGDEERSLENQFGIRSYPSFLLFHRNMTSPIEYRGPRTKDEIMRMVLGLVL